MIPMTKARPSSPSARTLADQLRPVLLRLSRELRREAQSLGVTGGQVSLLDTLQDPGAPDPAHVVDASELKDRVADAIARLPEREKLVIEAIQGGTVSLIVGPLNPSNDRGDCVMIGAAGHAVCDGRGFLRRGLAGLLRKYCSRAERHPQY